MTDPRCVVLIGAGFSTPFGVPTMRPFFDDFTSFARRRYPRLAESLDQLVDRIGDHGDLEDLLTVLNQAIGVEEGLPAGVDSERIRAWVDDARRLRAYLLSFIVDRCERFNPEKVAGLCGPLFVGIGDLPVSVFSSNYDRVVEHACDEASVELADGFARGADQVANQWTGDFDSALTFCKLHGSVTWYVDRHSDQTPVYLRLDRGYPLPDPDFRLSRGGSDLEPLMIIPTLEKEALSAPYNQLSLRFSDDLGRSRLVVVLGSSLRDEHLVGTITYRADRVVALVVSPRARDVATRLVGVPTVPLAVGTEQFLTVSVPALLELIRNATSHDSSPEDLEPLVEAFARTEDARIAEHYALTSEEREALETLSSSEKERLLPALRMLAGSRHPQVLTAVQALLEHEAAEVRSTSAGVLAVPGDEGTVPRLSGLALNDPAPLVRLEAALALRRIGGEAAEEALRRRAEERADDDFEDLLDASVVIPTE